MRNLAGGLAAVVLTAFATSASAAVITGLGNPVDHLALAGGTVIDFESAVFGSFNSHAFDDVTMTGTAGGGQLKVDGFYAGDYNTRGARYLDNGQGSVQQIVFDFASAVDAFAFNFGASDVVWTLQAYAGATLLDTLNINPLNASNAGQYFGAASAGITRAVLTGASGGDFIFVDNFTYSGGGGGGVPEPATWALMIGGFGLAGAALRRRRTLAIG